MILKDIYRYVITKDILMFAPVIAFIKFVLFFQDLIIFPDDIEFKHVTQCTTGRVFVLKFKTSSRKFFFWMQVLFN